MYTYNLNPTILNLGPLEIRWYGLVYVLGFLLAVWWLNYLHRKNFHHLSKDDVWDLIFYLMVGVLVGSRLFMIFWNPQTYLLQPWNLLKVWEGGMSFHGGLVGIIIACWLYCKKEKLDFWRIADSLSVPAIFALALGRIANFINGELVGRVWEGKWCVVFPAYGDLCRHPSTLYDAGKRFLIFGWLLWLSCKSWSRNFKPGFIFWNFVFWEGLGRIVVDFFREDPLFYGLSLGQWFSLVMVAIAVWFLVKKHGEDWKKVGFF